MFKTITKKTQEEELLVGCKKHDEQSREGVYQQWSPFMKGVCVRYVSDMAVAEDLMHEGFVKVFLGLHKVEWRGPGSFKGWVVRVMVNCCIDYLKQQKKLLEVPVDMASMVAVSEDDFDDEGSFSFEAAKNSGINCNDLLEILSTLPESIGVVFNMYAVEGMWHKIIAEILGIAEEASRARLKRARMQLREKLAIRLKQIEKVAQS